MERDWHFFNQIRPPPPTHTHFQGKNFSECELALGHKKKQKKQKTNKKKSYFTVRRAFQVGLVWQNIFFPFLVAKMTPLKEHLKSPQNLTFFEKYFQIFSKIFSQIFFDFCKKGMILHGFSMDPVGFSKPQKGKNNLPKRKNWFRVFFFRGLTIKMDLVVCAHYHVW